MGGKEILFNIYGNLLDGEQRDSIQYNTKTFLMGSKEVLFNIYGNLLDEEQRDSIQYIQEPS